MDILVQLNKAMEYIEEHITDDIELNDVSKVTSYSSFHFGRLFYYITDMSLFEYIRKRKLSLAAMKLQEENLKVIDLAVMFGYDSADSFTRAFTKQHGITPSKARDQGESLTIFPPLTFQINIKGVDAMSTRIEKRETFKVFGIERNFKNDESGDIPVFWDEIRNDGLLDELRENAAGNYLIAICGHIEEEAEEFPYMICCEVKEGCNTNGFKIVEIPKTTWAVFRSEGVTEMGRAIPELFKRAYTEWLPSSIYDKAPYPDMEIYGNPNDKEYYEEVWIPIKKKIEQN